MSAFGDKFRAFVQGVIVVAVDYVDIYIAYYVDIYIAEMQKKKRPILCYSEFRAKALVRQTITESHSELH